MFVYNDLKTDARVKRSINALKTDYDLLVCAKDSSYDASLSNGYRFKNVIGNEKSRAKRLINCLIYTAREYINDDAEIMYFHDYYSAPLLLVMGILKKDAIKVYDAHELMLLNDRPTIRERLVYIVDKLAIKKADLVICASDTRKELMKKNYRTKREILVINNISLLPKEVGIDKVYIEFPALKEFMNDSRKTVIYTGFLGGRKIDLLIDVAIELKDKVKILIVGAGDERKNLEEKKEKLNASNVFIMGAVPYSYLYPIIAGCDIGYLYYPNEGLNNINCAPNKVYEYASAGLPVVANNNPGLLYYLEKFKNGVASDSIKTAIETVLGNWNYYHNNTEHFIEQVDYSKEMNRLITEIKNVSRR